MSVYVETSAGDLVVDLFSDECPLACKNFVKLCKYANLRTFLSSHRYTCFSCFCAVRPPCTGFTAQEEPEHILNLHMMLPVFGLDLDVTVVCNAGQSTTTTACSSRYLGTSLRKLGILKMTAVEAALFMGTCSPFWLLARGMCILTAT